MTELEKEENKNTELTKLLIKSLEFMNKVPNKKYGNNYAICEEIEEYFKKQEED